MVILIRVILMWEPGNPDSAVAYQRSEPQHPDRDRRDVSLMTAARWRSTPRPARAALTHGDAHSSLARTADSSHGRWDLQRLICAITARQGELRMSEHLCVCVFTESETRQRLLRNVKKEVRHFHCLSDTEQMIDRSCRSLNLILLTVL